MRLHVISDVHGSVDALRGAATGADALVCLGDLLLYLDYADHARGIFAELFGPEAASEYIRLRTAKRFGDAREFAAGLWRRLGGEPSEHMAAAIARQYADLFAALPEPAYLTYGNVDVPRLWPRYLRPGHRVLDGETIELDGRVFGFVGGGLPSVYQTPNEIAEEDYAAKVAAVSGADVICAHIPPAVPELLYDTVARRLERGSEALLAEIRRCQPRYALFGHVHQPLARRTRIGRTECVNVGHFRGGGAPFVLAW